MKENGLVNTIFDLAYVNALLNIVLEFLQPAWLIADWSNSKYLQKERVSVFQIKLNKMMEMPSFDFAQAYSYYLQMIYICSFYGYLLPAITPMLLIAFSVAQRTSFVWGGCMLLRRARLVPDECGVVQVGCQGCLVLHA